MGKVLGITLAMMCLLCAPASVFAQNTPLNLNYQNSLLFKRTTIFQQDSLNPPTMTPTPLALITQPPAMEYRGLIAPFNRPIYSLIKNEGLIYEYWQDLKTQASRNILAEHKTLKSLTVDHNVFNALYNKPKVNEKKRIRQAWKKIFGLDVWYPYYKAKEIEDWVKERMSVRFFGFKGKPRFENDQILYVFRTTF